MSVNQKHIAYDRYTYPRRAVRDSIEGSVAIKMANELYLPMPLGFEIDASNPPSDPNHPASLEMTPNRAQNPGPDLLSTNIPWYHQNKAYSQYLQRARYPEITVHTMRGLVGTVGRKDPEIELPSQIDYLLEDATKDGKSLFEFYISLVCEVCQVGNVDIIIGVNEETNQLYLQSYKAENRINWIEDDGKLSAINFQFKIREDGEEEFEFEEIDLNLVYKQIDDIVILTKYKEGDEESTKELGVQGTKFPSIPVITVGSIENKPYPQPAILGGIAEIALAIYRKDADLSQAQYMTCNPTLCITGADNNFLPNMIGSTVALTVSNPDAKVYYTQTDTSGLDHVKQNIADLFEEAVLYGASLIGPSKKAAESEETVKIRQNVQGSNLVMIVENVSKAIQDALDLCATVSGSDSSKVLFDAPTDFADKTISPQMLMALKDLWLSAGLSRHSLIRLIKEAGLLGPDVDVEDEITRIENEGPKDFPISELDAVNDEEENEEEIENG